MVKSDAKQQESSLSETSSLSPHHHQVGGKLVIAINSPVACCLIRKLSWCLRAQLSFCLPGKTAASDRATFDPTILWPKANTKQKEKSNDVFD